jgi:hypothetical protein
MRKLSIYEEQHVTITIKKNVERLFSQPYRCLFVTFLG